MTNSNEQHPQHDWNKLAQEMLDLWQGHINTLANDPKLKDDMARMVAPMGEMFTQWATTMQHTLQGLSPFSQNATEAAAETPLWGDTASKDPEWNAQASNEPVAAETVAAAPVAEAATEAAPVVVAVQESAPVSAAAPEVAAAPPPVVEEDVNRTLEAMLASLRVEPGEVSIEQVDTNAPAAAVEPEPVAVQPPDRGRTVAADGSSDLAQLASRLAQLERELEGLRGGSKGSGESDGDAGDAGNVQRVAGTGQG